MVVQPRPGHRAERQLAGQARVGTSQTSAVDLFGEVFAATIFPGEQRSEGNAARPAVSGWPSFV
jgi:hypothetical protein